MIPVTSASPAASPATTDPRLTRRFRVRKDLRIEPQLYGGEPCFILKDPVSLAYFRFSPAQYALLELIDGRTLAEIGDAAERKLGPGRHDREAISGMLTQLATSGLITHDGVRQGAALHERASVLAQGRRRALLGSLLYFKLPGIDPEPVLKRIHPWLKWIYSPLAVLAAVSLMLFAGGYTLVHLDQFLVRIREESLEQFLSVKTIFWLWLALGLSKIVHEFGHGLTCRHFGGECHEMGVLFLVFSPCLYCDATDAWTMPNKWHRIAVSAGGIYVELVIASLATLIWWHTSAGILHNISLALMTLCSLNTFLLNANPLMRFDGYYILSDLLEVPNLRLKAQQAFQSFVDRRLLGLSSAAPDLAALGGRKWPFITYAVASWLYKWLLCIGILWFFYTVLKPYRLGSLSLMLAVVVAVQLLLVPVWKNARRMWSARRNPGGVRWGRTLTAAGGLGGLALAALCVPIPHRVTAAAVLRGVGQQTVHSEVRGRVASIHVRNGDRVQAGDVLARMANPELELEVARLMAETRRLHKTADKFASLGRPAEEQATRELLRRAEAGLAVRRRQQDLLTVRAGAGGRIVFAERVPERTRTEHGYRALSEWTETPLCSHNVGSCWDVGTPLCDLQPSQELEAVLYVEQTDVPFVAPGQTVRLKLDSVPHMTLEGMIREISRMEAAQVPAQVLSVTGGELPARMENGLSYPLPAVVCYEVRASLSPMPQTVGSAPATWLLTGSRGRAKITCGNWTCYEWARRRLFELWAL